MFGGKRPQVGRQEKEVRSLGRAVWWISRVLLIGCMSMTGLYGWSWGGGSTEAVDVALAKSVAAMALFAGIDLLGANMIRVAGTASAVKKHTDTWVCLGVALCCAVAAWFGIMGFLTENREAKVQARTRATQISNAYLDWSKTTASDALDKGKQRAKAEDVAATIEAVGRVASGQIAMLQSGKLSPLADGVGASEHTRWMQNNGLAVIFLFGTYMAWFVRGRIQHSIAPAIVAQEAAAAFNGHRRLSGLSADNPDKGDNIDRYIGWPEGNAREDFKALRAGGFDPRRRGALSFLMRRWGWGIERVRKFVIAHGIELPSPSPRRRNRNSVEKSDSLNGMVGTPNGRVHV